MTRFKVLKKVDLSFLGDEWEGCYLEFAALTFEDAKELQGLNPDNVTETTEKALSLLQDHLIDGQGIDEDGKKVKITKSDIKNLPIEVMAKAVEALAGGVSKNA